MRLLVVEDETRLAAALQRGLQAEGFAVDVTHDGAEGLRRVPLSGFDLRRTIAVYGIAGRRRSAVASTLLNMLRAADWSAYAR